MVDVVRERAFDVEVRKGKDLTNRAESVKVGLRGYWDKEEINSMIDKVKTAKDGMLLRFLWMSGVRITEALSLKKKDIDFANYTMRVRWLKSRKYNERVVPLHPRLRDLLIVYTGALNGDDLVFPFSRQRAWQITMACLGGNPHKLRHSFAVNWLRQGADLVTLHRILGHSKIQTTMEYLKIVPIDQGKELIKIQF